jgi:hypothetical protein
MNIAVFFNLPSLSMLNKTARLLLHYSFESDGINRETNMNQCKPFFHQVNQKSGKIYMKYPRVYYNGSNRKIKTFSFAMPSQYLVDAYEERKRNYLLESTQGYLFEIVSIENKKQMKPKPLTELQKKILELWNQGLNQTQIGKELGKKQQYISENMAWMRNKGYSLEKPAI